MMYISNVQVTLYWTVAQVMLVIIHWFCHFRGCDHQTNCSSSVVRHRPCGAAESVRMRNVAPVTCMLLDTACMFIKSCMSHACNLKVRTCMSQSCYINVTCM